MEWAMLYGPDKQPNEAEIAAYIGSSLLEELDRFLRENYDCAPAYNHSSCSAQPGWNIQYQKAGKALCRVYPMEGHFIALVIIGRKEEPETQLSLPFLDEETQALFQKTPFSAGGRWLMIPVTKSEILDDVKRLIQIRRKIKKKV